VTPNERKLFADACAIILNKGINLSFTHETRVCYTSPQAKPIEGIHCRGYFDYDLRRLAITTKLPTFKWFETFIHEYCHFLQWAEESPAYMDLIENDAFRILSNLGANKKDTKEQQKHIKDALDLLQFIELGYEKRVIALITQYNIHINLNKYIRNANAYIFFYTFMKKKFQWYNKPSYEVDEILEIMPDKFLSDYSKLPKGYIKLMEKYCYE